MGKKVAAFIFYLLGWKVKGNVPEQIKKYIVLAGPHTSNWDFFYARLAFLIRGIPLKFFIKKEWFVFPLSVLFKLLGGIPVDRNKKENLTDQMVHVFNDYEELAIMIPPEGTRSYNPNWKKGFYYISKKANVPIVLGYIDFENKVGGLGPVFDISDNVDEDIKEIKKFYKNIKGKHPKRGVR